MRAACRKLLCAVVTMALGAWPLFELLASGGKLYVMQSYAQIKDRSLSLAKLAGLGKHLSLPAGWRYRTHKLNRPLVLSAQRTATIVQDELQDTYQLAPAHSPAG